MLAYGLLGMHQMPAKPVSGGASPDAMRAVCIQTGSTSQPTFRAEIASALGIAMCAGTVVLKSPTSAMQCVLMITDLLSQDGRLGK